MHFQTFTTTCIIVSAASISTRCAVLVSTSLVPRPPCPAFVACSTKSGGKRAQLLSLEVQKAAGREFPPLFVLQATKAGRGGLGMRLVSTSNTFVISGWWGILDMAFMALTFTLLAILLIYGSRYARSTFKLSNAVLLLAKLLLESESLENPLLTPHLTPVNFSNRVVTTLLLLHNSLCTILTEC